MYKQQSTGYKQVNIRFLTDNAIYVGYMYIYIFICALTYKMCSSVENIYMSQRCAFSDSVHQTEHRKTMSSLFAGVHILVQKGLHF